MSFHQRAQATATSMIARYGQAAVLRKVTAGTGYNPTETTADHDCQIVVQAYRNFEIDGTRIQSGDKRVLVSHMAQTPTTQDQIVIAGESHAIVSVKPLSPGGVVIMWEVQARL
ncbi:hypothetical protein [uncultured Brevundimonas sp.]|uniref:hypothetical protein n=1 Tax=uncultured Brevundimonas sp. TaxID=213418 RepID=UPI00261AB746|nr:hypothetical protein [uncultured Brevundimonas sp.]